MDEATSVELRERIAAQRQAVAAGQARLAELCVEYAEVRRGEEEAEVRVAPPPVVPGAARPGEFVADELSLVLGMPAWQVQCLLAGTRRIRHALPQVAQAARAGELDADRVREIDKAARQVRDPGVLAVLDDQAVAAAGTKTVPQLRGWLQRTLARLEPEALAHRHRVALADRRVSVAQSVTGMGYVTGEVSAVDAGLIDARLTSLARGLGAADPRTEQQRRSDLFAGLLLGSVVLTGRAGGSAAGRADRDHPGGSGTVLEVEQIDPGTGELLGTRLVCLDPDGAPTDADPTDDSVAPTVIERPVPARIGVVVPLASLLGVDETPGELPDRSGVVSAEVVRELAGRSDTLFTRLLVDDGGRILQVTELGRYPSARLAEAVRLRTGSCSFPSCSKSSQHCDVDHHEPVPRGPTRGDNLDPLCRRHHRGKTFAGLASRRDGDAIEWTLPDRERYRCQDEPWTLAA